jgi:hypothetical protein
MKNSIRKICCGYRDENEVLHECGKVLVDEPEDERGISHGLCDDCFQKSEEVMDRMGYKKLEDDK